MQTVWIYIAFVLGVVLIVKCGDMFVEAAGWIACVSGIPAFVIGATVVSFATTLPELIVSSIAAAHGMEALAIGNAVGSVTANTGLILCTSILFMPLTLGRRQFMGKAVLLIVSLCALLLLTMDGLLTAGEGLLLLALFALFVAENLRAAKREDAGGGRPPKPGRKTVAGNVVKFIVGAAGIVVGSRLLVDGGSIARMLGVPESVIGFTVLAIGTSLPELVTAVTALVKRETSLSVGNILGANIIDTVLILPVCAFISGGALPLESSMLMVDLPVCIAITLMVLLPAFLRADSAAGRRFRPWPATSATWPTSVRSDAPAGLCMARVNSV